MKGTKVFRMAFTTILAASFCATASANPAWTYLSTNGPSPRYATSMVYDSCRDVMVLFGGYDKVDRFGDTWEWDGNSWIFCSTNGPSPRVMNSMAFDENRCVVVLFGGTDETGVLNDTWEWDGRTWTRVCEDCPPPARWSSRMVYDSTRRVVLLFGGYHLGLLNDTWQWDGMTWEPVPTTPPPAPRSDFAMAYDAARDRTVVFGGSLSPTICGARSDETWELDMSASPATWEQILTPTTPSARSEVEMVYDSSRSVMVLFGGGVECGSIGPFGDTWEYDGDDWYLAGTSTAPLPRHYYALGFDAGREEVLLFGGAISPATAQGPNDVIGDTWSYGIQSVIVGMDIRPGACPNTLNRNSHGVLPVALVGTLDFDVMDVDLSTVRLSRADGVGGAVAPHEGPPGPHSTYEDVATPFDGETCDCHDLGGDGIVDLLMKFRVDDLVEVLELDTFAPGDTIELVVTGQLLDGTPFEAYDCVEIVPKGMPPGLVSIQSTVDGGWFDIDVLDEQLDGGGFGNFERMYWPGDIVNVTAPAYSGNRRFRRWIVDDVRQPVGQRSIELEVYGEETTAKAVYETPMYQPQPVKQNGLVPLPPE